MFAWNGPPRQRPSDTPPPAGRSGKRAETHDPAVSGTPAIGTDTKRQDSCRNRPTPRPGASREQGGRQGTAAPWRDLRWTVTHRKARETAASAPETRTDLPRQAPLHPGHGSPWPQGQNTPQDGSPPCDVAGPSRDRSGLGPVETATAPNIRPDRTPRPVRSDGDADPFCSPARTAQVSGNGDRRRRRHPQGTLRRTGTSRTDTRRHGSVHDREVRPMWTRFVPQGHEEGP